MRCAKKRYGQVRNASQALALKRAGSNDGGRGIGRGARPARQRERDPRFGSLRHLPADAIARAPAVPAAGWLRAARRRRRRADNVTRRTAQQLREGDRFRVAARCSGRQAELAARLHRSAADAARRAAPSRFSSAPASTTAAKGRSIARSSGVITTGASSCGAAGRNAASSSASSTQRVELVERHRLGVVDGARRLRRCSAASTCRPASSRMSVVHAPQACSARQAASQPARRCVRRCVECAQARCMRCATAPPRAGRVRLRRRRRRHRAPAPQRTFERLERRRRLRRRGPGRRTRLQPVEPVVAARAGTRGAQQAITVAPARVVDSFQPVSSSIGTWRRDSSARTRRISLRSWAISATGVCRGQM